MEPVDDVRWETARARERDDAFALVFATRTTSIACRPGWPLRTGVRACYRTRLAAGARVTE